MTEGIVQSDFEKCKVHRESMYAIDSSCSIARRMLNRDEILFYKMPTDSPVLKGIVSDTTCRMYLFPPKWAVRPEYRTSLGKNFVDPFDGDIREMVVRGCLNK